MQPYPDLAEKDTEPLAKCKGTQRARDAPFTLAKEPDTGSLVKEYFEDTLCGVD